MESSLFGMFQNTQIKLKNNSLKRASVKFRSMFGDYWHWLAMYLHMLKGVGALNRRRRKSKKSKCSLNSTTGTLASRRNFHSGRRHSSKRDLYRSKSFNVLYQELSRYIASSFDQFQVLYSQNIVQWHILETYRLP